MTMVTTRVMIIPLEDHQDVPDCRSWIGQLDLLGANPQGEFWGHPGEMSQPPALDLLIEKQQLLFLF